MSGRRWLACVVGVFGAICVAIAAAHLVLGLRAIPGVSEAALRDPTLDSEDRFYASIFLGFGLALAWCARSLDARRRALDALLAVFLLGGLARLASMAAVGLPQPLFVVLCGVEIALPLLLWAWRRAVLEVPRAGS